MIGKESRERLLARVWRLPTRVGGDINECAGTTQRIPTCPGHRRTTRIAQMRFQCCDRIAEHNPVETPMPNPMLTVENTCVCDHLFSRTSSTMSLGAQVKDYRYLSSTARGGVGFWGHQRLSGNHSIYKVPLREIARLPGVTQDELDRRHY